MDVWVQLTEKLFFVGVVAMGAAFVFLVLQRTTIAKQYQQAVTVSAIVVGIACAHYFRMQFSFEDALANWSPGMSLYEAGWQSSLRYVDWILTVPLMLVEVMAVLALGAAGRDTLRRLIVLSAVMIGTGYVGEISEAGSSSYWIWFIVSMGAYLVIYNDLNKLLSNLGRGFSAEVKTMLGYVRNLIVFGWIVYPVGYLIPVLAPDSLQLEVARQAAYNVADMVNKIGLGVLIYGIARLRTAEDEKGTRRRAAAA